MQVLIPIHVEVEEPKIAEQVDTVMKKDPEFWIDCPFKEHGCHKRGEKSEVKRHVRDDR